MTSKGTKEHSNYSNECSNLHNYSQEQTNTSKQNTDFLSTRRTVKDNQKQAVPYLILGTKNINGKASHSGDHSPTSYRTGIFPVFQYSLRSFWLKRFAC